MTFKGIFSPPRKKAMKTFSIAPAVKMLYRDINMVVLYCMALQVTLLISNTQTKVGKGIIYNIHWLSEGREKRGHLTRCFIHPARTDGYVVSKPCLFIAWATRIFQLICRLFIACTRVLQPHPVSHPHTCSAIMLFARVIISIYYYSFPAPDRRISYNNK